MFLGVFMLLLFIILLGPYWYFGAASPIIFTVMGLIFLPFGGGSWVIFNPERDAVAKVGGRWMNATFHTELMGKLSELTAVQTTLVYGRKGGARHNVVFVFGQKRVNLTKMGTGTNPQNLINAMSEWWKINRPNQQVVFGGNSFIGMAMQGAMQNAMALQNVMRQQMGGAGGQPQGGGVDAGQLQAVRALLVEMKLSNDSVRTQSAKNIEMALNINPQSIVGTYNACAQRQLARDQLERMLADSADTILRAQGMVPVQGAVGAAGAAPPAAGGYGVTGAGRTAEGGVIR